jgi:hypothetical protein
MKRYHIKSYIHCRAGESAKGLFFHLPLTCRRPETARTMARQGGRQMKIRNHFVVGYVYHWNCYERL